MVSALISRLVVLTAGTLYPAYRSYKAVRTKDVREYVKWMMYWIVFAAYLVLETLTDIFVSFWCPFYYELKIIFVIWLLSPYTKGASLIYRKFIHPTLSKHEKDIDQYLDKAKNEGYSTIVRLGSKSIIYAREVVANAAIRGQAQLVQQLKKSYSLNDISRDEDEFQEQHALEYPRRKSTTGHRLRIQEIKEESEEGEEFAHSDGEEQQSERVWTGYYEGAQVVEEEFRYLFDEETEATVGPRRSKRSRKAVHHPEVEAYATLPRAAGRRRGVRGALPRD